MRVLLLPWCDMRRIGGIQQFVRGLAEEARTAPRRGLDFLFLPPELHDKLLSASATYIGPILRSEVTDLVRAHGIDLVHTHNILGVPLLAVDRWSAEIGMRHITTVHDVPTAGFDRRALASIRNTFVATQSEFNRERLAQINGLQTELLPVGTSFAEFTPSSDPEERCVAFPGRLAPSKGMDEGVAILETVASRSGPIRLLFSDIRRDAFGSNPAYRDLLLDLIDRAEHLRVEFVHDDTGVAEMYQAAMLTLCLPRSVEGFALTPLESLACGRPVVARLTGGMCEWLRDWPGVIEVRDAAEACAAVEATLASSAEWSQRAIAGRAALQDRFDLPVVVDAHLKCYAMLRSNASR